MNKIELITKYGKGEIQQGIKYGKSPSDPIVWRVVSLMDDGVRSALIEMGWVPPERMAALQDAWDDCGGWPDTADERQRLHRLIVDAGPSHQTEGGDS